MEHKLNPIILIPIFIILLVIIFRTIKDNLKFDAVGSLILSICVSVLATIGLNSNIRGTVGAILIPYVTLAICILVAVLFAFLFKTHKKATDRFSDIAKKNLPTEINEREKSNLDTNRIKK